MQETLLCIVTCILIDRQKLAKQIPAEANVRNRKSIAKQLRVKRASSTIRVCVLCVIRAEGLQKDIVRRRDQVLEVENGSRVESEGSNFETPGCLDMSLGAEEMNGVESSELART
jgi:hypothetical protein